jgi:hypothetical protein
MKRLPRFLTGCFLILLSSQRETFAAVKYSQTSLPRVLSASPLSGENVITRARTYYKMISMKSPAECLRVCHR